MASRINVEEQLTSDPRFTKMSERIGRQLAFGAILCLWEIGQSYWKKYELIPNHLAEHLPNIKELIEFGLAKKEDDGVYCSGARERWGFLTCRSEAGKASAKARRDKYGSATPSNASNSPNKNRTNIDDQLELRPPNKPPNKTEQTSEHPPNKTEPSGSGSGSKDLLSFKDRDIKPDSTNTQIPASPPIKPELHWLAILWNQNVTSLPKVKSVGDSRLKAINAALKKRSDAEEWSVIVKNVQDSDFLSGRDAKWTNCGFDWILNEANAAKIFEGNYKNKTKKQFTHQRENESFDAESEQAWDQGGQK